MCVVLGTAFVWGLNGDGQLGQGHTRPVTQPVALHMMYGVNLVDIACEDVCLVWGGWRWYCLLFIVCVALIAGGCWLRWGGD